MSLEKIIKSTTYRSGESGLPKKAHLLDRDLDPCRKGKEINPQSGWATGLTGFDEKSDGGYHESHYHLIHPRPDVEPERIVDFSVSWIPSSPSPATSTEEISGEGRRHGRIIVDRVTCSRRADPVVSDLSIPEPPGGESGARRSAAQGIEGVCGRYVAEKIADPAWKKSTESWVTPVCDNVASVADVVGGLKEQWHDIALGEPIHKLGAQLGLPNLGDAAGLVRLTPLPGDTSFKFGKRLVQYTGIVIGVMAGQPLLANACMKSLAHDVVIKAVSETIGHFLKDTCGVTDGRSHQTTDKGSSRQSHGSFL